MVEIGIDEAKTNLADLLKRVEMGELVTITNEGVPVADLVPSASRVAQCQRTADAIAALKAMRRQNKIAITQSEFIEMRKSGRR